MLEVKITDEYIDQSTYEFNDVIVRKENLPELSNKFELLCKTIKYYTGQDIKSPELTIMDWTFPYSNCICSCIKCKILFVINYDDIYLGIGSTCIKKFENDKLDAQLYNLTKARKCDECKTPLVIKQNPYYNVNCKKGDDVCCNCKFKIIYFDIPYSRKETAKTCGARWNPEEKKWYIFRNNYNYNYLAAFFKRLN